MRGAPVASRRDRTGERGERIAALEADVAALRSRLGRAEGDAAAARILAGGAGRGVGVIRGEFREWLAGVVDRWSDLADEGRTLG